MVCKEDVLQWFKELESYERIDLMHELLHMCLPFEIRFLGGCVEEVGKHSFQELRGPSIIANDIDKLSKDVTQFGAGVLDRNCRHRMCIYLSLLENRNYQCAHWYFKQVFRTEQFDEFAMRQKCADDSALLNELLMVFTLGRLHPAFNYHQKEFFSDMLAKLLRIRADKSHVVKSVVNVGVPNYPPGLGYPNQLVPYVILCDQLSTTPQPLQCVDALCVVKTSTTASSSSSTSSVLAGAISGTIAGASGDVLTVAAPPPPGLIPMHAQPQYHHPQSYEHFNSYWRQQPMYTLPDHMIVQPPQPVSPLVSQGASPPHSRPASPSPSNHSGSAQSKTQHQQQSVRSSSSSLRGSKNSSLESAQSSSQVHVRMPSATMFVRPANVQQQQVSEAPKIGDNETNHVLSEDKSVSIVHQDWTNPTLNHLPHFAQPHFTFAAHPHHMAPHAAQAPNGLRHCFAANFHPHHAVIAIDQQQPMFGYDLDFQQQQQLNDMQLDNTLHQSGSSSNNSSNASSLNQSPPDTPASTPTPAHHGPGRGNRDGVICGITEKLRVLNNVNSVPFMTPPPPPISDGNMPPQQPPFTFNVPYTGLGGRPVFSRAPVFPHSFAAPPPPLMSQQQQQQVHGAQAQAPPPTAFIVGTTAYIMQPAILNINGNPVPVPPHSNTNTGSLRSQHVHQSTSNQPSTTTNNTNSCASANPSLSLAGSGVVTSPSNCCTFCCNCGSSEHEDADCTASHIDDIVTQAGYALDYDYTGHGVRMVVQQAPPPTGQVIVAAEHNNIMPDI